MAIGGSTALSPAEQAEELRGRLRQREAEWREAHPDHADEAVPVAAKRRDVVWAAMERQLAKAEAAVCQ